MGFWQETIRPRAKIFIESVINEQLLKERGLRMEFNFDELDIFQEDEKQRSASYYNYVSAGMPQSIAAEILGIDLPHGVEYADLDEMAIEKLQRENEQLEETPELENRPRQLDEELRAWLRFEEKRIGKEDKRVFECEFIPPSLAGAIQGALETAKSKDDIKRIFKQASQWNNYP